MSSLKLQQDAPAPEISAAGQLVMLTQRIGKSANEFLTMEGVSPEAVFLLGKDLNTFKEIADALLNGSDELRLKATSDTQIRERLEALLKMYDQTRTEAAAILGNLQGLVSAREAQASIIAAIMKKPARSPSPAGCVASQAHTASASRAAMLPAMAWPRSWRWKPARQAWAWPSPSTPSRAARHRIPLPATKSPPRVTPSPPSQ